MAKFKVLSPVEHNHTHFWPEAQVGAPTQPGQAPSFADGTAAPVDSSGVIELSDAEARPLLNSRAIEPLREKQKPESRIQKEK